MQGAAPAWTDPARLPEDHPEYVAFTGGLGIAGGHGAARNRERRAVTAAAAALCRRARREERARARRERRAVEAQMLQAGGQASLHAPGE